MKIKNTLILAAILLFNQGHSSALRNFLTRIPKKELIQNNPTNSLSEWLKSRSLSELQAIREIERANFYKKAGNDLITILGLGGSLALLEYVKNRPDFSYTATWTPGYEDFTGYPTE